MKFFKNLNDDDKDTMVIVICVSVMILFFWITILTTIRPRAPKPPTRYDLECISTPIKNPLERCKIDNKKEVK